MPVQSLTLEHSIDSFPRLSFETLLDNFKVTSQSSVPVGAVAINIPLFAKLTAIMQKKVLEHFAVTSDTFLEIIQGDDALAFQGFLVQPSVNFGRTTTIGLASIHVMSMLQAFNPSLYATSEFYGLPEPETEQDSVASRIKTLLITLRDSYTSSVVYPGDETLDPKPIEKMNELAWPFVEEFLDASIPKTRYPGMRSTGANGYSVNQRLITLMMGSDSFLDFVMAVCNEFQLQFNCTWGNSAWMEKITCLNDPSGRYIKSMVENVSFTMSSADRIPPVQLVLQGELNEFYGDPSLTGPRVSGLSTNPLDGVGRIVAAFPETNSDAVGRYIIAQAPSWVGSPAKAFAEIPTEVTGDRMQTIAAQQTDQQDQLDSKADAQLKLLQQLAKNMFIRIYLAGSRASVMTPLLLTVQVGRTYSVKSMEGDVIFQGFLASVTHRIEMQSEAASAVSVLNFTHIVSPYYTPAKLKASKS